MATAKKYIEAVGRRKTATARVRITPAAKNKVVVNGKKMEEYLSTTTLQGTVNAALEGEKFEVSAKVMGGGVAAQAEAIRHGISRALIKDDSTRRADLKEKGFLTRDQRSKERKKAGLKGARRGAQWSKR